MGGRGCGCLECGCIPCCIVLDVYFYSSHVNVDVSKFVRGNRAIFQQLIQSTTDISLAAPFTPSTETKSSRLYTSSQPICKAIGDFVVDVNTHIGIHTVTPTPTLHFQPMGAPSTTPGILAAFRRGVQHDKHPFHISIDVHNPRPICRH
jgi:hypothetical protein